MRPNLTQIDCYGFAASSEFFHRRKLEAYLVKETDGILYVCFGEGAKRPIHRIDKNPDGDVRIMWTWGAWADAETLDYVPINETLNVELELNYDKLHFYVDGDEKGAWSGDTAWVTSTYAVTGAGSHELEWRYTKDGSVSSYSDCAWVDNVTWTPEAS